MQTFRQQLQDTQVPEVTDAVSTKAWKTMQAPPEKEPELDSKTKQILAAEAPHNIKIVSKGKRTNLLQCNLHNCGQFDTFGSV